MKTIDERLKMYIKEQVRFMYYRKGELWYQTASNSFRFPVPIDDTGDGTFLNVDKGSVFMRWIRKQLQKEVEENNHIA